MADYLPAPVTFESILQELQALHDKKAADYGQAGDPMANVRASEAFGIPAWIGVAVRMNDKVVRIQSFCQKGKLENESLEDSIMDIAVYSIMMLQLYRESKSVDKT